MKNASQLVLMAFVVAVPLVGADDEVTGDEGDVAGVDAGGDVEPLDVLGLLLQAAAKDYVSKDPAWPKRTEPCDKSS